MGNINLFSFNSKELWHKKNIFCTSQSSTSACVTIFVNILMFIYSQVKEEIRKDKLVFNRMYGTTWQKDLMTLRFIPC